jgi:hypothetical protein
LARCCWFCRSLDAPWIQRQRPLRQDLRALQGKQARPGNRAILGNLDSKAQRAKPEMQARPAIVDAEDRAEIKVRRARPATRAEMDVTRHVQRASIATRILTMEE